MPRRDYWLAGIAMGVGLAVIAALVVSGLSQQHSDGGGPRDGDLISISTAPPVVPDQNGAVECLTALFGGRLVTSPRWGLALMSGNEPPTLTFWPNGFVGRVAGDRIELLDNDGEVVARTGDQIEVGGGMTTINGLEGWIVCPIGIEVQAAAP